MPKSSRPRLTAAPWHPSYLAGRAFGAAMRLVPFRHRFGVAARLAAGMVVPMRTLALFRSMRLFLRLNSEHDLSLHLLLRAMTASGTRFDVPLSLEGEEALEGALASGRGIVLVSPHALLSRLLLRHLHDRGHQPTVIGGMDRIPLTGTDSALATVKPTPTVLLMARRRLREGGIVCANVDRVSKRVAGKRIVRLDSAAGELRVSDAIFRLAVRCEAQVLFTFARAEPGGVRQWIAAPRLESRGSAEAITADFLDFLQLHVKTSS